jgi:hypothetical protein
MQHLIHLDMCTRRTEYHYNLSWAREILTHFLSIRRTLFHYEVYSLFFGCGNEIIKCLVSDHKKQLWVYFSFSWWYDDFHSLARSSLARLCVLSKVNCVSRAMNCNFSFMNWILFANYSRESHKVSLSFSRRQQRRRWWLRLVNYRKRHDRRWPHCSQWAETIKVKRAARERSASIKSDDDIKTTLESDLLMQRSSSERHGGGGWWTL